MADLTRETAQQLVSDAAWKDLRRVLITGLLGGVAARAAAGVYGNIDRNVQRARERKETDSRPAGEFTMPVKAADTSPPRPGWFVPSAVLGTAGAVYGGWAGMSRLVKAYRQMKARKELEQAKQEFDDALLAEGQTKFSHDLNELADAWAAGELDDTLASAALNKEAGIFDEASTAVRGIPPAFYTLAALLTGIGGLTGWKWMGESPEAIRVRAYRESMRRRRARQPVSLVAKPKAVGPTMPSDPVNKPEAKDSDTTLSADEKSAAVKEAINWVKALRVGKGLGKTLGTGAAGGLATSAMMTKLPLGRRFLGNRAEDLLNDPEFVDKTMASLTNNPALMDAVYKKMLPAIKQQILRRNPWMGRLSQHFV